MKIILTEFVDIIKDFYKMRKESQSEKFFIVGIPILIGIIAFCVGMFMPRIWDISVINLMEDFINQLISVLALFISFSIAYIGMIITSSSNIISEMKETGSEHYKLKGKNVTIFQVLHCLMTYTVSVEVIFLIIIFAEKILIYLMDAFLVKIIFCFNISCLLHIVILICIQIKEIYFSFWKG